MFSFMPLMLATSCNNQISDSFDSENLDNEAYAKYMACSNKPIVSALDIALKKTEPTRSEDYNLGLNLEDVNLLLSLDEEGLIALQNDIMESWGFQSAEEVENNIEESFNVICEEMDDEEFQKFNAFIEQYLEMPQGKTSLELFDAFNPATPSSPYESLYIQAAVNIDNFGRKLYDSIGETRSEAFCKKYLAARIAIASVSMMAGMILPGPGWVTAVAVICDTAGATADYINCLRTRSE